MIAGLFLGVAACAGEASVSKLDTRADSIVAVRVENVQRVERVRRSVSVKRKPSSGWLVPAIEFKRCEFDLTDGRMIPAEVGHLTVPEVRTPDGKPSPGTRFITVAITRIKGTARQGVPPTIYLDGAPQAVAASGAIRIPELYAFFERLLSAGDVVLVDYRGSGLSRPLVTCTAAPVDDGDAFLDRQKAASLFERNARSCARSLDERNIDTRGYTWREVASDIADLRTSLNAPKIRLLGFSSGTHAALAVLRTQPAAIERLVLVGTEGPDQTRKLPSDRDSTIHRISSLVAKDPAWTGHEDFAATVQRVLNRLKRDPMPITVNLRDSAGSRTLTGRIGAFGLAYLTAYSLSGPAEFGGMPALYAALDRGDTRGLQRILQRRAQSTTFNALGYLLDGASGISSEREARIKSEATASLLGDASSFPYPEILRPLNVAPLPDAFRQRVTSSVPTLFITGELDGNTPVSQAEEIRRGFSSSSHWVIGNAGHADPMRNVEVADEIAKFLATGSFPSMRITMSPPRFAPPPSSSR